MSAPSVTGAAGFNTSPMTLSTNNSLVPVSVTHRPLPQNFVPPQTQLVVQPLPPTSPVVALAPPAVTPPVVAPQAPAIADVVAVADAPTETVAPAEPIVPDAPAPTAPEGETVAAVPAGMVTDASFANRLSGLFAEVESAHLHWLPGRFVSKQREFDELAAQALSSPTLDWSLALAPLNPTTVAPRPALGQRILNRLRRNAEQVEAQDATTGLVFATELWASAILKAARNAQQPDRQNLWGSIAGTQVLVAARLKSLENNHGKHFSTLTRLNDRLNSAISQVRQENAGTAVSADAQESLNQGAADAPVDAVVAPAADAAAPGTVTA